MKRGLSLLVALTALLVAACSGGAGSSGGGVVPSSQNDLNQAAAPKPTPTVTDKGIKDTFRGGVTVGADNLVYASGSVGLQQFTQDLSLITPSSIALADASVPPDTWPVSPKGSTPSGPVATSGTTVSALGVVGTSTSALSLRPECGCVLQPFLAQYNVQTKTWFNVVMGKPGDKWVSLSAVPNGGGFFVVADTPTSAGGFSGIIIPVGPACGGDTALNLPLGVSTVGPDGNVWVTVDLSLSGISPITATPEILVVDPNQHRIVRTYTLAGGSHVTSLVSTATAVWYTDGGRNEIGQIPLGSTGPPNTFKIKSGSGQQPMEITVGTDDAMWFTESNGNKIGRIDIATKTITEFKVPTPNSHPHGIYGCTTSGPCVTGKLFFNEDHGVGRVRY